MEYERKFYPGGSNGMSSAHEAQQKKHNYKLIIDPMIHQRGGQKIYRFDGIDPADNTIISVKDPRPRYLRFWTKRIPADLPVPKFKFDEHFVGLPPPNEVTFTNLNDNINKDFLENMCKGFGKIEESKIYYNPKTKKHMGIGKVLFTSSKSAKACANKLNQTSKMGNIMNVFVDSLGEKRQKIIDDILDDRPKTTKPPSPKLDPRSGRPFDLAAALHIDHDPPAHQNTLPDMYNTSSGGKGEHAGLDQGPNHHNNLYIPLEQTPSDFSFSSNHSDGGYLSATPASSYHGDNNFGRNQFNNSNNNQYGANYGHGNSGGYNNRNQIPPPQSPFVKSSAGFGNTPSTGFGGTPSGSSFGGTPMSYDSSVPKTPITPQTPQAPPPMNDVKNDRYGGYDNRDRGGRNFQNRDKRDRGRDSYNRDRNKDSDWNRSRNNDWNKSDKYSSRDSRDKNKRDWRNERDDWGNRDRNRYNRDKDRSSRNDYRDCREEEPPPPRPKVMEHKPAFPPQEEVYTPEVYKPEVYKPEVFTPTVPPPAFTPQPPEVIKEEEEPRSMSLDSRIQSLLSGFKSPEPKPKEEPTPKVVPTHPPVLPSTPAVSVHDDQAQYSNPSVDTSGSSNSQQWSTQNAYTNGSSAVAPAQDDDDRMSLDSAGSAGEQGAIEINPADTSVPPPPLPSQIQSEFTNPVSQVSNWQQQNDIANSYMSGFVNTYNSGGRFNQNYINQFNNNLNNQNFDVPKEEEEERNDPDIHEATFNTALEDFVKELKEIMTKDLCKKMVENSAFKSYERWWDKESGKNKPQKLLPEKTRPSEVAKSVPIAKPAEVSSALAGLFSQSDRPRHPWSKEGEFNIGAAYGGSMGIGGGFLGIRTGMPRMPSFKKKVPPKSEEEIEREEKRERRDKERRERKEKKKREKEKEDQKKQESESEKDDIVVSEEGSKRKSIFSDSESEGEDKEEGDSEGESEAATSSSDEDSSDSDDSNDDDDDDDDDDESGSSSSEAESSESSSSDEEGEETKSETKADKKDDSDNEPVKVVSSSSSSSSDTSSSESESSSSEDEEEEEKGAAVEKQIEEKEDGEITTESEVDKQDEEAEKMEVEDVKSLEKIIREKTPDQQSSRSNTPIDVEKLMSTENKMDVEEPTDECIEKLAEMLKQKPVNKKTQKKSPGRPKKSQPQTPPVVDNNQQQNLFDKFNPQSDNTLSGLSLLSEAASMSLRELVQQPSLARTMEDKAAQEEAERSEWLENRPSFLSEHAYYARPANADDKDSNATLSAGEDEIVDDDLKNHRLIWIDHNYCLTPSPQLMVDMQKEYEQTLQLAKDIEEQNARQQAEIERTEKLKEVLSPEKPKKGRKRKITNEALTDITNNKISTKTKEKGNRELANLLEPVKPKEVVKFKARTLDEERQMFFNMFNKGIDAEDINYLMKSYENLLQTDDPMFYWLNDILWVDHAVTNIPDPVPPKRKRKGDTEIVTTKHKTGCARTEGYYKLSMKEKAAYLQHAYNQQKAAEKAKQVEEIGSKSHKLQTTTVRELRHENRRLQTSLQDLDLGDLFKFNQLKFRKKQLKFGRSSIHSWGLFALEPIATDEMVIEYVGTGLRQSVADLREKQYEAKGIGSSYLFRVDGETIIDATKTGNLARFINHSCNPNCYAKVITVDGQKKIVIYSRRDIDVNEEITYDYKFPIEDDKITCFCGASNCRGFLN